MTQLLPEKPSISLYKKQAKTLLKQCRESNPEAVATVIANHPKSESFSGLPDAQLVVARTYGFHGWSELCEGVEHAQDAAKNLLDRATLFIQLGCVQYSGNDRLRNYQRAQKLLLASPEIATYSFYTSLVANNAKAVFDCLAANPKLAVVSGGPLEWPPLLYVLYSRISESTHSKSSLAIVNQLLDFGADPNSHVILNDTYRFTALTGAMGEGEQGVNQPPHQYADDMVQLLLERGAHPNDGQGLYNTMFSGSVDKWLGVLLEKGLTANDLLNWDNTVEGLQVTTLDFQLASAVQGNCQSRVRVLLNAGANPNTVNTYNGGAVHTNALLAGYAEIAELLRDNGAVIEELGSKDQFKLACVREDVDAIACLLVAHPTLIEDAELLHAAATNSTMRIVELLIEKGFDINAQSEHGRTLLHNFALSNDTSGIQRLLSLGAKTDIFDNSHQSNAAGFAAHTASYDAMRVLLDASNSLLDVVCCAYLDRARALVAESPKMLHEKTERGNTALHIVGYWLQDVPEYEVYKPVVECLIAAGADVNAINKEGQTPVQLNLANGFDTLADVLAEYS